ncbi:MAG TPA: serine hydrolase [Ohtaekwangia sp.]|uniref:serine hydrolase n=1 Tax=Ohtaekwangia sp. TaxID=2066019 RepID=UPI002F91FFB1
MNTFLKTCLLAILSLSSLYAQGQASTSSASASTQNVIANLQKKIPDLMKEADIPGISVALIRDGKLVWVNAFGVMNTTTKQPVDASTVFEAASLTKVVVAYGVLKLVDQDKLGLDVPLNKYLGNNYDVVNDSRIDQITARHVLTHSSGFPNWRVDDAPSLPINFTPGEKFSYSGEGFVYLSKVVEKITGQAFTDYIQTTVLTPLQMKSSSLTWRDDYATRAVHRHDAVGNVSFRYEGKDCNAAASLRTTAEDYARFMLVLMKGTGLKPATWQEMMKPQIYVNKEHPQVAWGLGVGLEITNDGKGFWHWGDQGDSKAFMNARLDQKNGIVYFTNSANGLSIAKEILDEAVGGTHPSLVWLDYERYNSPGRLLLKSILAHGAPEALTTWTAARKSDPKQFISENQINSLGYILLRMKKVDDAIEIFRQNSIDFPQSSNVWDSLAEGYMTRGDKALAIQYYEKSLQLDPNNKNGEEQLKKLRQ